MTSHEMSSEGPDARRVHDLDSLADELARLQVRAAVGSGRRRVTYAEVTRLLGLPATTKSTIHSYLTGKTLPPAEVLDRIVIALGATPPEQREWAEAWFRVSASRSKSRVGANVDSTVLTKGANGVLEKLYRKLQATSERQLDFVSVSAQNLDLVYQVDLIAPDYESEVGKPIECPGGSGANTTYALARLGVRTATIGVTGSDEYGQVLREDLAKAGVDTSLLIELKEDHTGHTMIFTDRDGRRLIYVQPAANESFARAFQSQSVTDTVDELLRSVRIIHVSSFTGVAERRLQESLVRDLDEDVLLSFTPGALYSAMGADRLSRFLIRTNVLFLYEQQLDQMLAGSSAQSVKADASVTDKLAILFEWRARRGSVDPFVVVVKRPADFVKGRARKYLSIGYGCKSLEEVGGPDASSHGYNVVDSTGAGDALAAGFLFGALLQKAPEECHNLAFLMALAASSALGARAAIPTRADLFDIWSAHLSNIPAPGWLLADHLAKVVDSGPGGTPNLRH
jgi:ribokinase